MGGETSESDDSSELREKKCRKTIKKAKHRIQKYRPQWEQIPALRLWLRVDKSSIYKARCEKCNVSFKSELTVIKNHAESSKHKSWCAEANLQNKLTKFVSPANDNVHSAEIKLAGFLVAHNVSYKTADHLCDLLKSIFIDSTIAQEIKLKRTKATAIVKNVIGKSQKEQLVEKIKKNKFSIMTDESTDIAAIKTTCIVVRFYEEDVEKVVSRFWDLAQLFSDEKSNNLEIAATAEHLFSAIMRSFDEHDVPHSNIIGFGSDGCNIMMGCKNSVSTRFRALCPGIIIIKCVSHSLALCASEACKKLPRICEDTLRNIVNYFKCNSKRIAQLAQFQHFLDLEVHKLLHPSQTRWLSLRAVVDRILEQWDALKLFFDHEYLAERLTAVEQIHQHLHNPFMKAYYLFLQWALPKFTDLNKFFQADTVVITSLHSKMVFAVKDLLGSFMKQDYLARTSLQKIDPTDSTKYLPLLNLYLGVGVMKQLDREDVQGSPDLITDFKLRCREFLVTGCQQIQQRYNFQDPVLSTISILVSERVPVKEI